MVAVVTTCADPAFWHGRRVLVTGHTGFKGSWLAFWLTRLGAEVTGIGLAPNTDPSLYDALRLAERVDSHIADIRDAEAVAGLVRTAKPEVVFHLAAQPLVRESYRLPVATFAANVMGTAHVLDALRSSPGTRVAVMITTDKVYANREWAYPYREDDILGGHDPYAASKAACELVIDSYRLSFLAGLGVAVASARAGNVIGGGDWSLDRLIPDAVRAWGDGNVLQIRRPQAVRPWQHVLEPLHAYMVLAQRLWHDPSLAQPFNIGPSTEGRASVREVIEIARQAFGIGETIFDADPVGPHESGTLALETAKARECLGIMPNWGLKAAIDRTMAWYAAFGAGRPAEALCADDIAAFEKLP